MTEIAWSIFGLAGVLLMGAAVMDVRWRSLPIALPFVILCLGAVFFIMRFWVLGEASVQPPSTVLVGAAILSFLGVVAFAVGLVGLSDAVIGAALVLLVLGLDEQSQVLLAILVMSGTSMASLIWFLHRARKSIRISGAPRNLWDVAALFKGRIEKEPQLRRYPDRGRRGRRDGDLSHIEAFRTPDGCHLYRDPCPFVACLFVGYLFLLVGIL